MSYTPLHGFPSTTNNSSTPLAAATTFTGTIEQNNVPDIMVSCFADVAGTLYIDYSDNTTDWETDTFVIEAGVHVTHIKRKGPRNTRVRFLNGAAPQTTFRLFTYYGWFEPESITLNKTLTPSTDAIMVKALISGLGDLTALVTNHQALQVVPPPEGKTAFGETVTAEPFPVIQLKFPYNDLNHQLIDSRANQSGSVTAANSMMVMSSGAAANSFASGLSTDIIDYRSGQGIKNRFTAIFTTGVAGSKQTAGIGDSGEGFFMGFDGAALGVLHRYGGNPEVRTLTVTTKSTTAENITITLDGDALATVAVTDATATDVTTTANEIAAADYSSVGEGWAAAAVGDRVVFTSWMSSSKTGTYSLSVATTAVGTFAQTLAGVTPTEDWTPQADWNGRDKFDGNGLTETTIVPTTGNVFQIKFQYLGFGAVQFYIEDPIDGELHLIHTIAYANANTRPSLDNPSLPLCGSAENTSNTTDIIVSIGSMSGFIEGKLGLLGARHGVKASITLGATSAETPITTIRGVEVYQSAINRTKVKLLLIGASADHTKPVEVNFYRNLTLTGASFSPIETDSTIEQDTLATVADLASGEYLFTLSLGKNGNEIIDVSNPNLGLGLVPGEAITATIAPKSGNAAEASVNIYLVELF